jgi:hypothetical protein
MSEAQNQLFCPKCGDLLIASGETMKCVKGEMELSQRLFSGLRECYIENTRSPKDITFTHNGKAHPIGGRWFCPACGVKIAEAITGVLKCPKCTRSVVEFIFDLIELHPHN